MKKDSEVLITALRGVLTICRAAGMTRAEMKAIVDEVCNGAACTKNSELTRDAWIDAVASHMRIGLSPREAQARVGPHPRDDSKAKTQNEHIEEEWISLVQNMMDNGYDKEWAIRQAGPPPREGMENEI